jgi:hypothetical protein|tara:strand:- start:306 stop:413 length:108 start_codon:yes stop_codon:yes gene_type:complete
MSKEYIPVTVTYGKHGESKHKKAKSTNRQKPKKRK